MLLQAIDRERPKVVAVRAKLQKAVASFLADVGTRAAMRVRGAAHKIAKAMGDEDDLRDPVSGVDWTPLEDAIRQYAEDVAKDGAEEALNQVGADDLEAMLHQANERAIAWAQDHAAEQVVEIEQTTREKIKAAVTAALEEGKTNEQIADELQGSAWFGGSRAETIARTETAFADIAGNLEGWRVSGVVAGKEWITSQTDPCEECAALDGEVRPLDQEFPGGDPPLHPRCECDLLPVLAEEDDEG